jgi:hypothetical protein
MSPTPSIQGVALNSIEVAKLLNDIHILFYDFSSLKAIFAPNETPIEINAKFLEYKGYSSPETFFNLGNHVAHLLKSVTIIETTQRVESEQAREQRQCSEDEAFSQLRNQYETMKREVVELRLHFEKIASHTYPFPVTYKVIGNHPNVHIKPEQTAFTPLIKIEPTEAEDLHASTPLSTQGNRYPRNSTSTSTSGYGYRYKVGKKVTPAKIMKQTESAKVSNDLDRMMLKMSFSNEHKQHVKEVTDLEPQPWAQFKELEDALHAIKSTPSTPRSTTRIPRVKKIKLTIGKSAKSQQLKTPPASSPIAMNLPHRLSPKKPNAIDMELLGL